jgi:hypothetical protein
MVFGETVDPDQWDEIFERLAQGQSLVKITSYKNMPSYRTVTRALAIPENNRLRDRYMKAREDAADVLAEEIIDIADADPGVTEHGVDNGAVNHQRLRVDARKWVAAKLKPRKYGERVDMAIEGRITLEGLLTAAREQQVRTIDTVAVRESLPEPQPEPQLEPQSAESRTSA